LAVCTPCLEFITPLGFACQRCAYPLPDNTYLICGHCIKKPPFFDRAYIAYPFEEPLRSLIHQFKYHNGLYLARFLAKLMLNALPESSFTAECLIPVPMHPKRLRQRGFNQAAILTTLLARSLNIPYDLVKCTKNVNTVPQASLNEAQRRSNLRKAFHCSDLPFKHVAIIDDLLTTGSTANELAHILKNTGVEQVDIWCCARAVSKD